MPHLFRCENLGHLPLLKRTMKFQGSLSATGKDSHSMDFPNLSTAAAPEEGLTQMNDPIGARQRGVCFLRLSTFRGWVEFCAFWWVTIWLKTVRSRWTLASRV